MALIDNLKRAAQGPSPGEQRKIIDAKLKTAEAALAEIEAKRDAASLDALIEAPGARDALARLNVTSREAREQIETLQAAMRAAIVREQEASRAIRRDAIKHAFSRTKAHLKARDEASAEFAAAAENLAAAYAKIYAAEEAARSAWGIANVGEFPNVAFDNSGMGEGAIARVCAAELWKHTPTRKDGEVLAHLALPAAAFPALEFQHWPEGVPDLKSQFESNTAAILKTIATKVPE